MKNVIMSFLMMVWATIIVDLRMAQYHRRAFWYSVHMVLYFVWHHLFHQQTSQIARWNARFRAWYYIDKPKNRRDWGSYTTWPAIWFWHLENWMKYPLGVAGPLDRWMRNQYKYEPRPEHSIGFVGDEA